jgi:hypothetical protein
MVPLGLLLNPIGLSALLVLIANVLAWIVLPYRRSDMRELPDEPATLEALGRHPLPAGVYRFPYAADPTTVYDPVFMEKLSRGPVGLLTITRPGSFSLGRALGFSLLHYSAVSLLVAYLAGRTLPAGAHALPVFRVAGTIAVAAYTGALLPGSIWWGRPWSHTAKDTAEGIVYGLVTGLTFAWLWPR